MKKLNVVILCVLVTISGICETMRQPFDNIGFVWKPEKVDILMTYLRDHCDSFEKKSIPIAGICPHDDYLYASDIAYPMIKEIKASEIVIFGVTHRTARELLNNPENVIILDSFDTWYAPYGPLIVSPLRELIKSRMDSKDVMISNTAHNNEHSIEAMIPYLQYFNKNVKVTPIMVTSMTPERVTSISEKLSEIISEYMNKNNLKPGKDIFFLFSCDANHYGPDFKNNFFGSGEEGVKKGTEKDKYIAATYLSGKMNSKKINGFINSIEENQAYWCGKYSVSFGLKTVLNIMKQKEIIGEIVKYSDTYNHGVLPLKQNGFGITAPFSTEHWVGHLSALYY